MPVFKCSFFFTQGGWGWSETHYTLKTDHAQALTELDTMRQFRTAILGKGSLPDDQNPFLQYARVSQDDIPGDSRVAEYTLNAGTGSTGLGQADIPNTCLLVRLEAGVLHRRSMYLRGIPDNIVTQGGQYTPYPGWTRPYNAWASYMTGGIRAGGGWGIRIPLNPPALAGTIIDVVQAAHSKVVNVTTAALHGLTVGNIIVIKGRNVAWLRGRHRVIGVTAANVFQISIDAPVGQIVNGPLVYRIDPFGVIPYDTTVAERITHRITGRPFDQPRGRRSPIRL